MHNQLLLCFKLPASARDFRPKATAWTITEILEHVSLTSHYLLKLIDKGAGKALRNVRGLDLQYLLADHQFDPSRLEKIGVYQSFIWERPDHMVPTGSVPDQEVMTTLVAQLTRCLNHMDELQNGEGLLYDTTMSVQDLGRLNVYEYIHFLSLHAARHLGQVESNLTAFRDAN